MAPRDTQDFAAAAPRLRLNPDGLAAKRRLAGFHAGNNYLVQSRLYADATGLDPVTLLIACTLAVGSIQRSIQGAANGCCAATHEPPDDVQSQPMSRRRIAEATGLPRESVRRRVARLVELGFAREDGRGVTMVRMFGEAPMEGALEKSLGRQLMITNLLLREGVFTLDGATVAAAA